MELTAGLIVQKPRMDEIWRILALIKPISLVKPSWAAFSRAFHPSWRHRQQFRILTRHAGPGEFLRLRHQTMPYMRSVMFEELERSRPLLPHLLTDPPPPPSSLFSPLS